MHVRNIALTNAGNLADLSLTNKTSVYSVGYVDIDSTLRFACTHRIPAQYPYNKTYKGNAR